MPTYNNRPVFNRLPVKGYQDNSIADALTQFYDSKLVAVGRQAENLHTKLDPNTTPEAYLDWLATLVGMVDPYYSLRWSVPVKRKAIATAQTLFRNRGTLKGLQLALDIHGFSYQIHTSDDLRLPFLLTSETKFGSISDIVFVRLPLEYPRRSYAFLEAERAVKHYTAITNPVKVCYDHFYLDYSVIGDPLF
jgi:phage tail-like protein